MILGGWLVFGRWLFFVVLDVVGWWMEVGMNEKI